VRTAAEPKQVRAALAAAARAGEFFRLEVLDEDSPAGWRRADAGLAGLAEGTARRLGTGEPRVAASILHLSLAARVWSPVLHCGWVSGVVPDLGSVLITAGPAARLGTTRLAGRTAPDRPALPGLTAAAVAAPLRQIEAGLPARLPAGLARGNSASAMAGALGMLVRAHPDLARPAVQLARALLQTEDLRGGGTLSASRDGEPGFGFRRTSCCLYYRVPGGGLCGDCCLDRVPG
jgi:FhuF 2Fe-2S C-terminal domain